MTSRTIALIGRSDLAEAYQRDHPENIYHRFFRPEYDITVQNHCDRIVDQCQADVFLITAGAYKGDSWLLWMTNCVGPSYLAQRLYETRTNTQIIIVSSQGARWTSWPGIPSERLTYNSAKHATSQFAEALYQSSQTSNRVTVIDPGRFQSRMSDHTGMETQRLSAVIDQVIQSPPDINLVNVQIAWHRDRNNQPGGVDAK